MQDRWTLANKHKKEYARTEDWKWCGLEMFLKSSGIKGSIASDGFEGMIVFQGLWPNQCVSPLMDLKSDGIIGRW